MTWSHVSTLFTGQAVTALAVDPTNPQPRSTPRPSAAAAATTARPPRPTRKYGVWESTNGGTSWTLRKGTSDEIHGATDLVMDPQNPQGPLGLVLGRRRSTSPPTAARPGPAPSATCRPATSSRAAPASRSASRTRPARPTPTVYTGFDYFDTSDVYHPAAIYKTHRRRHDVDRRRPAPATGIDSVVGYCGTQCFYDNEVKPDPTNPDVVYVARRPTATTTRPQSGGIYRSTDGGADLAEPRATTCTPTSTPSPSSPTTPSTSPSATTAASGSRHDRWRAQRRGDPLSAADWENLNGDGRPDHRRAGPLHRAGDHPVHLDARRCRTSPASTGAARRTTARCASRWPTAAGSTRPAVTAAR